MPNWKAPGPDFVQGFWSKVFKNDLEETCKNGNVPMRMTKERTILMQKDKENGNAASNYRPVTCLPLVWKLLTEVIAEETYGFLDTNSLLPEEQKTRWRKSGETNDILITDAMIMRKVKMWERNLSMAWIDYKKACDMVPYSWIIDCLETVGINEKIRRPLTESTKSLRVELISG